jgi:hypothetical protein
MEVCPLLVANRADIFLKIPAPGIALAVKRLACSIDMETPFF